MAAKLQNKPLKLTQIIYRVDTIVYNASAGLSDRYPRRRTQDKELVSFGRTLRRLCEDGCVQNDGRFGPHYTLTNKGARKVDEIKEEIKKRRKELDQLEFFVKNTSAR
jgi:hypothetical protein